MVEATCLPSSTTAKMDAVGDPIIAGALSVTMCIFQRMFMWKIKPDYIQHIYTKQTSNTEQTNGNFSIFFLGPPEVPRS
jgi:hypothetical protein